MKYLSVLLCAVLCGCSSTTSPTTAKVAEKIAVQYATIKVIKNNPTKAQAILDISSNIRKVAGTEGLDTVDALIALAKSSVDFSKLQPEDAFLATSLLDLIGAELKSDPRVGGGVLTADKLLVVGEVASWVEEQAKLFVPAK